MDPNFAKEDGERGKIKMFLTVFACSNNFVVVVQHINKDEIMFVRGDNWGTSGFRRNFFWKHTA